MPEGHKTHFLAADHQAKLAGQALSVSSPQGRFRSDARKVTGSVLSHVQAVGKHLFYHFDGERIVHVHLGRYGKFRESKVPSPEPRGLVRMRIVGETMTLDLNGPTTCRVIDSDTQQQVIGKLGPDPLAGGSRATVWQLVQRSKKPIGAILLDQAIIAGVGNIFRAEVLYEAGVDPTTAGNELSRPAFDAIWKALKRQMKVGLKHGRIITVLRSEVDKPLAQLGNKERFRVYGVGQCGQCGQGIKVTESIAARKLHYCPACQTSR